MAVLKGKLGFKGEGATIDISEKVDGVVTITSTDNRGTQTTTISDGEITTDMIIDDLTHTSTDKPLSANQGNVLKGYIDANSDAIAAIAQTIYPVGCIYKSTSSTNPNSVFGFGTWIAMECNDLVDSGNITGANISSAKYRVFADGTFEVEAISTSYDLGSASTGVITITLPFTLTSVVCSPGLAYGGTEFANTSRYSYGSGSTITIISWNWGSATAENLQENVIAKGTLDLESNRIPTIYCWKRTA